MPLMPILFSTKSLLRSKLNSCVSLTIPVKKKKKPRSFFCPDSLPLPLAVTFSYKSSHFLKCQSTFSLQIVACLREFFSVAFSLHTPPSLINFFFPLSLRHQTRSNCAAVGRRQSAFPSFMSRIQKLCNFI